MKLDKKCMDTMSQMNKSLGAGIKEVNAKLEKAAASLNSATVNGLSSLDKKFTSQCDKLSTEINRTNNKIDKLPKGEVDAQPVGAPTPLTHARLRPLVALAARRRR